MHTRTCSSVACSLFIKLGAVVTSGYFTAERYSPCHIFPHAWHCLLAVFVSPSLITQTDASVEEALRNGSWLDVATVLPPSLGPSDVAQLLSKCAEISQDSDHKKGQVCTSCLNLPLPAVANGVNNLRHASASSVGRHASE
jgi:hypothetical protein